LRGASHLRILIHRENPLPAEDIMRVRDWLGHKSSTLITVEPKTELDSAARLLIDRNIGGLPVLKTDGTAAGFISERDIVRALLRHGGSVASLRVADVMRPPPLCDANDSVEEVMRRMTVERLRHLMVSESGSIVGVISVGDIVKHRLEQLETETGVLRDYLAAQRASR
jgi:CBS domain-containing protein